MIIKKDFNENVLPQILEDLNKNDESIIILRVYKTPKSITLKTYKVKQTFAKSELFEKKATTAKVINTTQNTYLNRHKSKLPIS